MEIKLIKFENVAIDIDSQIITIDSLLTNLCQLENFKLGMYKLLLISFLSVGARKLKVTFIADLV